MTVELADVEVVHGGRAVVGPITHRVPAGGWLCLIGPNGAGKSSLLHAMAGLVAHRGRIHVDGSPLDGLPPRRRARLVALVPQRPTVPDDMSVADYASLGRTPHISPFGVDGPHDRAVTAAVLDRLDLGAFAGRRLTTLSGGELQRVLLARALVQQAPVLLLDEPTTALDLGHQHQVLALVEELRRDLGLTVVTTMHDLTLAGAHADTLMLLDGGRAVAVGRPDDVLTEASLARIYHVGVEILRASDGTPVVVPVMPSERGKLPPRGVVPPAAGARANGINRPAL